MVAHSKVILLVFDISMKINFSSNAVPRCEEKIKFSYTHTHAYACTYSIFFNKLEDLIAFHFGGSIASYPETLANFKHLSFSSQSFPCSS